MRNYLCRNRPRSVRKTRFSRNNRETAPHRCRRLLCAVVAVFVTFAAKAADPVYNPVDGMVPDENTAIRIAEAVWIPLYGEEHVLVEEPYMATLHGNVWDVESVSPAAITEGGLFRPSCQIGWTYYFSQSWQIKMDDIALDNFKRATALTIKAIGERAELEVAFGSDAPGTSGTRVQVPLPAASLPFAEVAFGARVC